MGVRWRRSSRGCMRLSGLITTVKCEHSPRWAPVVARLRRYAQQLFSEADGGGTVVLGNNLISVVRIARRLDSLKSQHHDPTYERSR
jgi:hypothetical protein